LEDKQKVIENAERCAEKGFLCSESVLLAVGQWLSVRSNLIPKVATGFGAGVGRHGSVCGAISGGVIALGLKFGRAKPVKADKPPHWFAKELVDRFEKEFGHIECRDLTGCDLSADSGREKYKREEVWLTKCRNYIRSATAIAFDILSDNSVDP
jgi:C_GCAxxG_C_C family probable redox protein